MKGITFDELYELVSHYHDAEFTYNGVTYVLQPETMIRYIWLFGSVQIIQDVSVVMKTLAMNVYQGMLLNPY